MPRYIRVNTLRQNMREDLRIARSWRVLFLWGLKLFRHRVAAGSPIPISVPFHDFAVAKENLRPEAAQALRILLGEHAGFFEPLYQEIKTLRGENTLSVASLRHVGGEVVARVTHIRLGTVHPPQEKTAISLITSLADGRQLITTDQPTKFDSAPNVISQRRPGANLQQLLALHLAKLEELRLQSAPVRLPDDAAMMNSIDHVELESVEFNLRRGLYEEVPAHEIDAGAAQAASGPPIVGVDPTDALVLEEIEKLRTKRSSWRTAFTVGLLSLVAFLAAGRFRWSWEFIGLLTALVLLHEFGHYVAMRIFRYANLRMFFVPLLGAAVTGRHYNVKGWQRAVVYLAGPVPGIILGLMLAAASLVVHNPLLEKTALIALVLNGINLLPFVPLDGGWILHAIVFCRHFILETAFLALAGLALISASWLGQSRIWFYLGLLILIGLPASYRLARAASRLRARGVPSASPDDQNIPTSTALAILEELKQGTTALRSPKHLASQTLNVFQKLNATPPGALASLGLLLVYLAAGATALLGTGALFLSRLSGLGPVPESRAPKLTLAVEPVNVRVSGLTNEGEMDPAFAVTVATFTDAGQAESAFEAAGRESGARARVALFGQSIFLSGPEADERWPEWFRNRGAKTFLEQPASNITAMVRMACQAPDEATASALENECAAYFRSGWLKAWPPWVDLEGLDQETVKTIERIHHTQRRIHEARAIVSADPELKKLSRPARLRNASSQILETMARRAALERALYRRELEKLANSNDPGLDKDFVRFCAARQGSALSGEAETSESFQESALWKFGSMPERGPPQNPRSWRAADGDVRRYQLKLTFDYLLFYRTDYGLPTLAKYLAGRGCHDFHYELQEP